MAAGNESNLIFVYGTLRRGGGKESLLATASFVGEGTVAGTLYGLQEYPALVPGGDQRVEGEIWACGDETLSALDTYEGVADGLFTRVRVRTDGGDRCWAYVAGPELADRLTEGAQIRSGRWGG